VDHMYNNNFLNIKEKLTERDLEEIEKKFSFKIPKDIRHHYLKYNGGYPEKCIFEDNNGKQYEVEHFIPIKNKAGSRDLETVLHLLREDSILPNWLIPLAEEAGGDFYCYSLRNHELGAVYYWSHEFEYGEDPEAYVTFLATYLKQFIDEMIEDE